MLLSRTLARPLTEMSRAAAEIAAGNLDHPLTLDSPDEIGDLARALNRMAGDLRSHEEALRAERADLAAKNAELERFNYTVSHDLKSPLVTIRGFAGLAATDLAAGRPDRVRQDLGRIVAAADRMHRLLDELLELSRVGRVVNEPEDVLLGDARPGGARAGAGALESRGVSVEIAADLPVVRVDRRRFVEVFQNLLENAAKFADGGRSPAVEIGRRQEGGEGGLLRAGQRPGHRAALPRERLRPLREARPRWRRAPGSASRSCGGSSRLTAAGSGRSRRAWARGRRFGSRCLRGALLRGALLRGAGRRPVPQTVRKPGRPGKPARDPLSPATPSVLEGHRPADSSSTAVQGRGAARAVHVPYKDRTRPADRRLSFLAFQRTGQVRGA